MTEARRLAVLGGCGGIGRAIVARALADGWRTTVLDLPASIARHPVPDGVRAIPLDATDAGGVAAAFAGLAADGGPDGALDGFVNAAGYAGPMARLADTPDALWEEVTGGNLRAAFLTAKAAMPLLARGRDPAMVQLSSGLAAFARPNYGPYAAAKAALVSLTKTLALEHAPTVRVNAVGPGAIDTAFLRGGTGRSNEDGAPRFDIDAYAASVPMKRIGTVEDVTGPTMFLLGRESLYMTGQVLWVNGGAYMP